MLIKEQPALCILNDPRQPLLQVRTCHGAAGEDVPLVGADGAEVEVLGSVSLCMLDAERTFDAVRVRKTGGMRQKEDMKTYLDYFLLRHATPYVCLVGKDEKAGA